MEQRKHNPEERREILIQMVQELLPRTAAYLWELFLKQLHNGGHSESEVVELLFENINKYISGVTEEPLSPILIDTDPKLSQQELIQFIEGKLLPINSHLAKHFPKLSFESEPQTIEELHIAAALQIHELRNDIGDQQKKIQQYNIDPPQKNTYLSQLKKLEDDITEIEQIIEMTGEDDVIKKQRTELQKIRYEVNSIKYKLRKYENTHRPG